MGVAFQAYLKEAQELVVNENILLQSLGKKACDLARPLVSSIAAQLLSCCHLSELGCMLKLHAT